ncbi:MAG: VOC family protein [Acidimicrobiales bacterium]|jgi:catechol 2,3-dioxygenase-like lactoylglutathione lyase family enzyme
MLGSSELVAFVATTDIDRALVFYRDTLGLSLVEQGPFACVFDAHGTQLRVTPVGDIRTAPYTVLGWTVDDIGASVQALGAAGVRFERFEEVEQDGAGVWTAPNGARVAWFADPDGNVLSLTQSAALSGGAS